MQLKLLLLLLFIIYYLLIYFQENNHTLRKQSYFKKTFSFFKKIDHMQNTVFMVLLFGTIAIRSNGRIFGCDGY